MESLDLPKGTSVQAVAIPRGAKIAPESNPNLLGGVRVLRTSVEISTPRPWGAELYREVSTSDAQLVEVKLIPYYAWGNRGKSEMTVWMPLGGDR